MYIRLYSGCCFAVEILFLNYLQPKFLTRVEREALALKKREEQVAKQREAQKALLEKRKAFIQDAKRTGSVILHLNNS